MSPTQEQVKAGWHIKRSFIILTCIFFIILCGFGFMFHNIQNSRLESCQRTYSGIQDVFEVFFSEEPNAVEQKNIDKFNDRIEELRSQCDEQTGVR